MANETATLETTLGHTFADKNLLSLALTHASATDNHGLSNERLEFLGDRVLAIAIATELYRRFDNEAEGELARRFAGLTQRDALVRVAEAIKLDGFINTSKADAETKKRSHASVLADTLEAILGALYLDGGPDVSERFIIGAWDEQINEDAVPPKDAKTALQEWAQHQGFGLPRYETLEQTGPAHAPVFSVLVHLANGENEKGQGPSRRAAEQDAATMLMARLESMQL